jgi:hypothetical protein
MTVVLEFPESPGGGIRSFSLSISFHRGSPYAFITWGMNNTPVGGRISEMQSHIIDEQQQQQTQQVMCMNKEI